MQNKKRTLFQGLQILTAAALALIIFLVWVNKRPSDKNVEILDQIRTVTLLDKGWQFHKGMGGCHHPPRLGHLRPFQPGQ